jgi:hypothetical protein
METLLYLTARDTNSVPALNISFTHFSIAIRIKIPVPLFNKIEIGPLYNLNRVSVLKGCKKKR